MLFKKVWPIFGQSNSTPLFAMGSAGRLPDLSRNFVDSTIAGMPGEGSGLGY